ncbi:MAG: HlyD family type I secretion periplasmic adaptor subunit, partial [Verrucomicrobiota bacterium]
SSLKENIARQEGLEAQIARLKAESTGEEEIAFTEKIKTKRPDLVRSEQALFDTRTRENKKMQTRVEQSLELAKKELSMVIPLVQRKITPLTEQLRLQRDVNELEGDLEELKGGFRQEANEMLNEKQIEWESLTEAIKGSENRVDRTTVVSPVSGIVNNLFVSTLGGVIQPGEPIADIVPEDDTLIVEAKIRPSDIAFLRPQQEAVLKFTAYDFSIYGGLKGKVEHISADTIQDEVDQEHYYMIKVRNESGKLTKDGKELPIIPGMIVEVDVLTGRRTVLQYISKPFHRMRYNSLTER